MIRAYEVTVEVDEPFEFDTFLDDLRCDNRVLSFLEVEQ